MTSNHRATTEEIHASVLERGFDLNLVPHSYVILFKHQSTSYCDRLINEFNLGLLRVRIELKKHGYDWDQMELGQQKELFRTSCIDPEGRIRADNTRVFGDTQERMAALHHEGEKLDRAIEKGEITMKSVPKRDTKQIAEQN